MFYVLTLDSHDLYGPFTTRSKASTYGARFSTWQILTDAQCQREGLQHNLRLVPQAER